MSDQPRNHRHDDSRHKDDLDRRIEWQKTKNNLLGIIVALIVVTFAFDLGGIATSLAHYLFKG